MPANRVDIASSTYSVRVIAGTLHGLLQIISGKKTAFIAKLTEHQRCWQDSARFLVECDLKVAVADEDRLEPDRLSARVAAFNVVRYCLSLDKPVTDHPNSVLKPSTVLSVPFSGRRFGFRISF